MDKMEFEYRRFPLPDGKVDVGDLVIFDHAGEIMPYTIDTIGRIQFSYGGHVVEKYTTGILVGFDLGCAPPGK